MSGGFVQIRLVFRYLSICGPIPSGSATIGWPFDCTCDDKANNAEQDTAIRELESPDVCF